MMAVHDQPRTPRGGELVDHRETMPDGMTAPHASPGRLETLFLASDRHRREKSNRDATTAGRRATNAWPVAPPETPRCFDNAADRSVAMHRPIADTTPTA